MADILNIVNDFISDKIEDWVLQVKHGFRPNISYEPNNLFCTQRRRTTIVELNSNSSAPVEPARDRDQEDSHADAGVVEAVVVEHLHPERLHPDQEAAVVTRPTAFLEEHTSGLVAILELYVGFNL
jgi:hypothetical protein